MDLLLDTQTGDLAFVANDLAFVSGAEEVVQDLPLVLGMQKGDWVLDITLGLQYMDPDGTMPPELIFTKAPNLAILSAHIRQVIENHPGVVRVLTFTLEFDNTTRLLRCNFTALTDQGQAIEGQGTFDPEGSAGAVMFDLILVG